MNFDPFIIPFSVGATFLFVWLFGKLFGWIYTLPKRDQKKLQRHVFSFRILRTFGEIVRECLLHFRLFRINALLGYMHASLAAGWFLLIIFGTVESKVQSGKAFNMPYDPIFYRFFNHAPAHTIQLQTLSFLMDTFLLLVLSAVVFAWFKRLRSKWFGMRRTTRQSRVDRVALTALWLVFPLRFLAESATGAIYGNGDFFTGILGRASESDAVFRMIEYPAWWAYSISLCGFFVLLPFSRYMHIPAEIILVTFRRAGIGHLRRFSAFADIEVESCSRCGVCIDTCQLQKDVDIREVLPVYFLRSIRERDTNEKGASKCLVCGKCAQACPVRIDVNNQRIVQREEFNSNKNFQPLHFEKAQYSGGGKIGYYAGCMTHLTPSIKLAMVKILLAAEADFVFLDQEGSLCCGRPMLLAGEFNGAAAIAMRNEKLIKDCGIETLITSCPICLKMFSEEYQLNIPVLHHSQYIEQILEENKITLNLNRSSYTYHDPCELGRGLGIYDAPRSILTKAGKLIEPDLVRKHAPCCGGSIGSVNLTHAEKKAVTTIAIGKYVETHADILVVSCPLCKKTFVGPNKIKVMDIAEIVADRCEK
ncbi:MAG: 4Fe-4S dicluster domain-containing protein [Bacteroidetes bacterium]|nr:4Fe-4S dicluster domain-containing protein [Bacteroidota bacterium]MBU1720460.1 4Fe-4S dicluster domain-containing protein [Bacteroidota bacterium]